jgi:hypothetical protein
MDLLIHLALPTLPSASFWPLALLVTTIITVKVTVRMSRRG